MNTVKRILLVLVLAGVVVLAPFGSAWAGVFNYEPSIGTLPTDQGWGKEVFGVASKDEVDAGVFKQQSVNSNSVNSWSIEAGAFDFTSSLATTLEARIRVDSSDYATESGAWRAGYAIAMSDTGDHHFILGISDTGVRLTNNLSWLDANSSSFVAIDTTSTFNTFTLVAKDNAVELFVNGASTLTLGVGASSNPGLRDETFRFGDLSVLAGSTTELEYVNATTVPEPSTLLLYAGMMALGLGVWRRKKQR